MDAGAWPPPPPARPRGSRVAPPPRPDLPMARRGRWRVAVASAVAITMLVAVLGALGSGDHPARLLPGHDEYRFLQTLPNGQPYRWDGCTPIRYQVDLAHAPEGALVDVREAIARVASATGFRFVFDGTTERTADQQIGDAFQDPMPGPVWLPLLITWEPHSHFDYLVDSARAAAFGMPETGQGDGYDTYVSGLVVIDAGGHLSDGFGARYSLGVVLMHELGHVMGLAHVGSGDELMWSPRVQGGDASPDYRQTDWGPGDLAGLAILGGHAPCPSVSAAP